MWDGDVGSLMGQYMFLLAHVCHVTPDQLPGMRVIDFARLIDGVDEWIAAQSRMASG